MLLLLRSILLCFALIAVFYSIYYLDNKGINPAYFHIEAEAKPSFDPSRVTHLEWKAKNSIYVLDTDSDMKFHPIERNPIAKDLVRFLSQIQLNDIEQKGSPALEVAITVNSVTWTGAWDGLSFVWTTGPNKGKGEILKDEKNLVFFKGKHVFETLDINLCKNRISKVFLDAAGKTLTLEQSGRNWVITSSSNKPIDPIFIEKWLTGLCKVKAKSYLDLDYAQSDKQIGYLGFEFVGQNRLSFQQIEKDFYIWEGKGVFMEGLSRLHGELKAAISNYQP